MKSAKFSEIETKYRADEISLTNFHEFCKKRPNLKSYISAFGPDHFYAKAGNLDTFWRHRVGADMNQLTFKRKTSDANNFFRAEYNLNLEDMDLEQVAALVAEFGYKHNTSIYKACFVYKYDFYTLVYYFCYDLDMKEQGRYIEIEMAEDYKWVNQDDAWDQLVALERLCKPLGITPKGRIKRSLFEIFRK